MKVNSEDSLNEILSGDSSIFIKFLLKLGEIGLGKKLVNSFLVIRGF